MAEQERGQHSSRNSSTSAVLSTPRKRRWSPLLSFIESPLSNNQHSNDVTVIHYTYGRHHVPYLYKFPRKNITLMDFKSILAKKGNFRYFFRTVGDFEREVVFEELTEDSQVLPMWEDKVFCVIECMESSPRRRSLLFRVIESPPTNNSPSNDETVISYSYGRHSVPYSCKLPGKNITLRHLKSKLLKKGKFRYFLKTEREFETGVVFEEVTEDCTILPMWEGKVFCVIESMDE